MPEQGHALSSSAQFAIFETFLTSWNPYSISETSSEISGWCCPISKTFLTSSGSCSLSETSFLFSDSHCSIPETFLETSDSIWS
jgi:hypothetical protein